MNKNKQQKEQKTKEKPFSNIDHSKVILDKKQIKIRNEANN